MARILVVEDDNDLAGLLIQHLSNMNHVVLGCEGGAEALALVSRNPFDLVLLDLGLPQVDGLDVCKRLRQTDQHTAILMLTARNSELDRVLGLELGADDYLGKPFSLHELQARVRALLRRVTRPDQKEAGDHNRVLQFGTLSIDAAAHEVQCRGKPINLTAREFDLLYFLASHAGTVYSREQLLNSVWGYSNGVYEHTVNSNINRLRNKLEIDPANPVYIQTIRGTGYKFNAAAATRP